MHTSASRWITGILMAAAVSLTFVSSEALAKRMGSGGDSGMQRSMPAPSTPASKPATPGNQQPASAAAPAAGAATGAAAASKSSWMGPLAAFAAGGLLAALFMGGGFEGIGAMDILFLLLIVAGAYFFLRRRAQSTQTQTAGNMGNYQRQGIPQPAGASAATGGLRPVELGSRVGGSASVSGMTAAHFGQHTHPDWFDEQSFLTGAKDWFVRLQAAWDANDRATLAALTTPALFDELSAQLDGSSQHQTRVDEVHAQLMEMTRENGQWLVSVRFTGYIAEEAGAFPHAFREIWHLLRQGEADGSWKLAGIQQDVG